MTKKAILLVGSLLSIWITVVIGFAALSIYMEIHYPPAQRFIHIPDRFLPVLTFTMFFLGPLALILSTRSMFLSFQFLPQRLSRVVLTTLNAVGVLAALVDILWVVFLFTRPFPVPN